MCKRRLLQVGCATVFGKVAYSVLSLTEILIDRPLTNLQKASQKLRDHFEGINNESGKKYHLEAVQQAEAFKRVMEIKQIAIDQHSGGASN